MSTAELPSYAIVSPVKNEAEDFARTARSLIAQTHRPTRWVIVDDDSTDATRAIAEGYAREHDWITVISSGQQEQRARGGKVVRVFNVGLAELGQLPAFVVKMDGDLFLPAHYFEWVAATFACVARAGIVGGVTQLYDGERWCPEVRNNLTGALKAYRRECFEEIGGLQPSMGWDGIDEYSARARGWQVHVLDELPVLHYKARGSRQDWYRARWEEGVGAHYMGYRWDFLLVRAAYLAFVEPPPLLGAIVLTAAFVYSHLIGAPRVPDAQARRLLRADQRERLTRMLRLGGSRLRTPPLPGGGPAFWRTG